MRFLVSPDGCQGISVHELDLPVKEHLGWHDCSEMNDEVFDEFVTELQKKACKDSE